MAGRLRRSMEYLGLKDPDDAYYDDEDGYDEPARPVQRHVQPTAPAAPVRTPAMPTRAPVVDPSPTVTVVPTPAAPTEPRRMRITTHAPRNYNDARDVGEDFRGGAPVIMSLTDLDENDAKRLVDFAAGLTFGLRGRLERVTKGVFLLTPQNVEVSEQVKERIAEGDFFNQS